MSDSLIVSGKISFGLVKMSCNFIMETSPCENDLANPAHIYGKTQDCRDIVKPGDHWSYIAHLSAEDMLKSAVIEKKKFKHSPWAGADNQLGPTF